MVDQNSCRWVRIPGAQHVSLLIREGQPEKIMAAFAADYHAYIEPLRDADSACWTATNSVSSSNHLSGTGMDLNWNGPPEAPVFRYGITKERAYPGPKAKALDELLDWYEGMIFCGGYWSIRDWMHFQMGGNTYGSQHVAKVNDFIRRKIRPDGFSTYKRGGTTTPPEQPKPPVQVPAAIDVLVRATGLSVARAAEILPGIQTGLAESDATNPNRIAMWLAQMGHESASFKYTEEIASGAAYEGRKDLGNTQPGDGVRFKGRSWIQVTGRHNYTQLSKWAYEQGIVPTPTYFVDDSRRLAEIRYAGVGPAWYWTVARPQINRLSDERNLYAVTQAINGGQNGAADRKARYDRASALGVQLLALINTTPVPEEDELSAEAERKISEIHSEVLKRFPSRSPLRHLGEGAVDTIAGFTLNGDGHGHVQLVRLLAGYGHPGSLELLREVANADPVRYPDRQEDRQIARAILAEVTDVVPTARDTPVSAGPVPGLTEALQAQAYQASLQQQVVAEPTASSTGQVIGRAYDALEALQLSGVLNDTEKAPLLALIGVLQTKASDGETS
jgi:putative chitinase